MKKDTYLTNPTADYETKRDAFVLHVEARTQKYINKVFPSLDPPAFFVESGRKFDRIVEEEHNGSRRVWGFISRADGTHKGAPIKVGDILKADGWKSPAKHARGNIYVSFDEGYGPYGPDYLKNIGGDFSFRDIA